MRRALHEGQMPRPLQEKASMGSVAESHRRRGGQQALLARRIVDAIDAGCTAIVSETGEPIADEPNPSLANLLRCGFKVVASRLNLPGPP
jgi:hypothetical protein